MITNVKKRCLSETHDWGDGDALGDQGPPSTSERGIEGIAKLALEQIFDFFEDPYKCDLMLVNKRWAQIIRSEFDRRVLPLFEDIFFTEQWSQYGEVGPTPALPAELRTVALRPCPFISGKCIGQTHRLIMIPKTIKGAPFSDELRVKIFVEDFLLTKTFDHPVGKVCSDLMMANVRLGEGLVTACNNLYISDTI